MPRRHAAILALIPTLWDVLADASRPTRPRQRRPIHQQQIQQPNRNNQPSTAANPKAQQRPKPATRNRRDKPHTLRIPQHIPTPALETPAFRELSMADRYALVERAMLEANGIRVRKWRTSMSGVAWQVTYADGTVSKLIEAPRPRGPMSAAVFLHEIAHHAIGFDVYSPRCLEEYHAWAWSLNRMEELGLNVTDAVRRRMHESLWYALDKARRRGLKKIPQELIPYINRPGPRVRSAATPTPPKRARRHSARLDTA